jgi:hypothetical protein
MEEAEMIADRARKAKDPRSVAIGKCPSAALGIEGRGMLFLWKRQAGRGGLDRVVV